MILLRNEILRDPEDYSIDQLIDAIYEKKVVTKDELLSLKNNFSDNGKTALRQEIDNYEMRSWKKIENNLNEQIIRDFISVFPDGKLLLIARKKLEQICWEKIKDKQYPETMLVKYIDEFPTGEHYKLALLIIEYGPFSGTTIDKINRKIQEVKNNVDILDKNAELLKYLLGGLRCNEFKAGDLLGMIDCDHNVFNSFIIGELIKSKYITEEDLINKSHVDIEFIKYMVQNSSVHIQIESTLPQPKGELNQIENGYTEFYFWGIPSSGKTCALAGILSAANLGRVCTDFSPITNSQGYAYMCALSEFFHKGKVRNLPPGTAVTSTYEMKFDLVGRYEKIKSNGKEKYDNKYYRCAAIDLAGELFCAIHQKLAGEKLVGQYEKAMENLEKILVKNKSKNRKIHFFVIEYGAENRKFRGYTQDVYLRSCMRYIEENGIFDKNTDRIYIMVTKSDKFDVTEKNTETDILKKYIKEHYLGFYKNIKYLCQKYDINDGEPGIMAYNIGDVCFQDYCRFHPGKSESVVYSCFLDTVYGHDRGIFGKLKRTFGL